MLEDSHVNWLVQLKEHRWVELDLLIIPDKLKQECFVEDWVTRRCDDLCAETILQERNCHRELLVRPDVHKIDKCVSADNRAAHVPLVSVKLLITHHAPLARHYCRQASLCRVGC